MKPLISIITPLYNSERHLQACISSVLQQTNAHFELLLINDGSTDGSADICDRFAAQDARIKVWHTENGGVSAARNVGLAQAKGEWILFLDSDDLLDEQALSTVVALSEQHDDADMIIGSFKFVHPYHVETADNAYLIYDGLTAAYEYGVWHLKLCVGSYAVKHDLIRQRKLSFHQETAYGEDMEFATYCLLHSASVVTTPTYFVRYIIQSDSAIRRVSFAHFDNYEARQRALAHIKRYYPDAYTLQSLYTNALLPTALIDTAFLLLRHRVSLHEVMGYMRDKHYIEQIVRTAYNEEAPLALRRRALALFRRPRLTWLQVIVAMQYYEVRRWLGLAKRSWKR